MIRASVVLALTLGLGLVGQGRVVADTDVSPGDTTFIVTGSSAVDSHHTSGGTSNVVADPPTLVQIPVCAVGGDQLCAEGDVCSDGSAMELSWFAYSDGTTSTVWSNCPGEVESAAEPQVTPGLVSAAFRRLHLPASQLVVQPPNGRTLVNFRTNFYTERDEFTRVVRLLGQRVELRIWPARFGWRFGDGVERWTTSPGDKYPHLEVTHRYLSKGRVAPSVATTYAAQFRVGGGPWRDVNGTVTIPGTPQGLRVVTARPVLVGGS